MNIITNLPNKYIKIEYKNIKLGRVNSRINSLVYKNNIILSTILYLKKLRKNFNSIIYKYTGKYIKQIPYNYYYSNYRYLFNSSVIKYYYTIL